ncbi:hypothetical protein LINGRAHAP2_LOCUS13946 [Linum grandiflorum]
MSHLVLKIPATQLPTTAPNPSAAARSSPSKLPPRFIARRRRRTPTLSISCSCSSSSPVIGGGNDASQLERCFMAAPLMKGSGPVMKGNSKSGGAVTLEKGKVEKVSKSKAPEVETGGGGGDIGKIINNGGGDGGDDDGDDDDYFDDFEDDGEEGDEGGLFRRRRVFEEIFDKKFVDAILNEWQKTMMDLPAGIRQAYEMGLVSSAQMVKVLAINARPTTTRFIARTLPQSISRAFIGRMLADPSFLHKFFLEQVTTLGCSVWWELKNRGDRVSVTVPSVGTYALGYGAFLGLYANVRYQLLCGFDRAVVNHFDVIGVALFLSTALRVMNDQAGEVSRLAWLGVEVDPLAHSEELLKKAYNRPSSSEDANASETSKWFISKKALVSGLGLLGIKQGNAESGSSEPTASKPRRKRIVRKKVSAGSA